MDLLEHIIKQWILLNYYTNMTKYMAYYTILRTFASMKLNDNIERSIIWIYNRGSLDSSVHRNSNQKIIEFNCYN